MRFGFNKAKTTTTKTQKTTQILSDKLLFLNLCLHLNQFAIKITCFIDYKLPTKKINAKQNTHLILNFLLICESTHYFILVLTRSNSDDDGRV